MVASTNEIETGHSNNLVSVDESEFLEHPYDERVSPLMLLSKRCTTHEVDQRVGARHNDKCSAALVLGMTWPR